MSTTPKTMSSAFMTEALESVFASSFNLTLVLMMVVALVMYATSAVCRNYSWVDRSWSIMPVIYAWIHISYSTPGGFSALARKGHTALNNAAVMYGAIITLWGIRLTFNFARRGGYSRGNEDYRWAYIRNWPRMRNPILWELYSFSFIAFFQTALLWGLSLPVINVPSVPISGKDAILGSLMFMFILLEAVCDEQQWRFQRSKQELRSKNKAQWGDSQKDKFVSYGFCITGVFGHSRHLNVFCEGCIWMTVALAALVHGEFLWWQWAGCITLQCLTHYATAHITEKLSGEKYPMYALYQETTPMLIPSIRSNTARTHFLIQRQLHKSR